MLWKNGRTAKSSGFSLLELVIVMLIIFFSLGVSSRLMVLAQRRSLVEHRRILDPAVSLALSQLKADVKAALGGAAMPDSDGPLALIQPSGVVVTYELVDEELWRSVSDPPGRRQVLSAVKNFEWTWLEEYHVARKKPMLQIDVEYETTVLTGAIAVDDNTRSRVPRGLESRSLRLTLRGAGGVGW